MPIIRHNNNGIKPRVEIRKIQEPTVILFNPNNVIVGCIHSHLSFDDVRLQIAKQQLDGYSIEYQGQRIKIDRYGNLENWPNGLYDQDTDIIAELIGIRHNKSK